MAQQKQWLFTLEQTEQLARRQPDSAYIVLKELVATAREKNDLLVEGICLQQIGHIFYNYSNFTQSIDYLLQAEKIFRAIPAFDRLAATLNYLGTVYYSNKQVELAGLQFSEALRINTERKDLKGQAFTYGNMGHWYEKKLMYDTAYRYQQKALSLYVQMSDSVGMAKIFENMGSILEDYARYDSARLCFEKALAINRQHNDAIAQIEILNNLGDVYRKTGHYDDGLRFTRQALMLAEQTQSQYQLASAHRDMARGFELMKVFDSAYYYNEQSRSLVEKIYAASNNQQIAFLETVYEVEQKNGELLRLTAQKRINIIITISVALVVGLLIVLGIVVISRQRLRIRNEKALNEQNKDIYEKSRELMQVELRNKQLEEEQLKTTLGVRSNELSAHTLHLIQKNQLLEELRSKLQEIVDDDKRDQKKQLRQLVQKISLSFNQDNYWDDFRAIFDQVHQTFFANLKRHADNLTPAELRLVALLRMNLSSGDMATLLGISQDSLRVARYRLRKKLNLAEGESLTGFIQNL
ncbi:tetratricopeptide repeat protein [Paraflavitalea sp. CAU 1676]|nr:tetratricopeptide repeat protein [Paraflavitalea sp. CAU 1676]